jgi:hypothetical protein
MESFNQTNPIDNYNNLVKNLEETGEKFQKLKIKFGKIVVQLIQNPVLNKLLMNNIALIKKYLNLNIQLNISLKNYFAFIPLSSKYYDFVIYLNQSILLKIIIMETICKSRDAEKIHKYIDSFHNTEMGAMYGSFGNKLLGITADGLNKLSDIIRNFNTNSFIKTAKSSLETLQTNLEKQVGELSVKVTETISIPKIITTEIPTDLNSNIETEQFVELPQQNGGKKPFHKIYHPEIKKWVVVKSYEGIDALLKYTYCNR